MLRGLFLLFPCLWAVSAGADTLTRAQFRERYAEFQPESVGRFTNFPEFLRDAEDGPTVRAFLVGHAGVTATGEVVEGLAQPFATDSSVCVFLGSGECRILSLRDILLFTALPLVPPRAGAIAPIPCTSFIARPLP